MLSGVETAGLVLAAFPIVFQAFDEYKEGCEPLLDWWRFRLVLPKIVNQIRVHETLFRQNIQKLLLPIVDSNEVVERLCINLDSADWHSVELEAALQEYLGTSIYEDYVFLVTSMSEVMEKIKGVLNIKEGKVCWSPKPTDWTGQIYRVKVSLKKRTIQEHLDRFEKNLNLLEKILKNNQELRPLVATRVPRIGRLLKVICDGAATLYSTLQNGWYCTCQSSASSDFIPAHGAHLTLARGPKEQRPETYQPVFLVLLDKRGKTAWKQLRSSVDKSYHYELAKDSYSGKGRKVGFKQAEVESSPIPDEKYESLCVAFRLIKETPKDVLFRSPEAKHEHSVTIMDLYPDPTEFVSLQDILDSSAAKPLGGAAPPALFLCETPERGQRYALAVVLASAVIQLAGSPWLKNPLTKQNVIFALRSRSKTLSLSEPLIAQSNAPQTQQNTCSTRETLLQLGILLLELCFGETLESQPFRASYFGPDRKPHDQTDRMAASLWRDKVLGEAGPQYSEAIRLCIDCSFGLGPPNLETVETRQAVYDNVVVPLQQVAAIWQSN